MAPKEAIGGANVAVSDTLKAVDEGEEEEHRHQNKIYFKMLHIHPIHLNLTFRFTSKDPRSLLSLSR